MELFLDLLQFADSLAFVEALALFQLFDDAGEIAPRRPPDGIGVFLPEFLAVAAQVQVFAGPHGYAALAVGDGGVHQKLVVEHDGRVVFDLGDEDIRDVWAEFRQAEGLVPRDGDCPLPRAVVGNAFDLPGIPRFFKSRAFVKGIHHLVVSPLFPLSHAPFGGGDAHAIEPFRDGGDGKEQVNYTDGSPGVIFHHHGLDNVPSRDVIAE